MHRDVTLILLFILSCTAHGLHVRNAEQKRKCVHLKLGKTAVLTNMAPIEMCSCQQSETMRSIYKSFICRSFFFTFIASRIRGPSGDDGQSRIGYGARPGLVAGCGRSETTNLTARPVAYAQRTGRKAWFIAFEFISVKKCPKRFQQNFLDRKSPWKDSEIY